MLKLERRTLELTMPDGEPLNMRFPTLAQIEKIQKAEKEGQVDLSLTRNLFAELGMSAEKFDSLEPSHIGLIMESFVDSKKK